MMKKCKWCNCSLAISEFPVNARNKDGRDIRCKKCCAEKTRLWREANPASARASERKWKENNPQEAKANAKVRRARWIAAHPGIAVFHTNKWRAKNPDRFKDYSRKWARDNADKCAIKSSARRAATFSAIPPWLSAKDRSAIAGKFREAKRLSAETGVKYHVDHIIPLKGKEVCGLHVPWNLQVIPATVNQKKWNKIEGVSQ